jgi:hypothetical protein
MRSSAGPSCRSFPELDAGGAERTTLDVAEALADRRRARAGGQPRAAGMVGELQAQGRSSGLSGRQQEPAGDGRSTSRRLAALMPREAGRHRPCPLARAGLGRAMARRGDENALRHHLSRRLCRQRSDQAQLQFGHGARRRRHRQFPNFTAGIDRGALSAGRPAASGSSIAARISGASRPRRSIPSACALREAWGAAPDERIVLLPARLTRLEGPASC